MSEAEFNHEFSLMMERSHFTEDFLNGKVDPDTFLDYLDQAGIDVLGLSEDCWNLCNSLITPD
jgi:hypothetical protein